LRNLNKVCMTKTYQYNHDVTQSKLEGVLGLLLKMSEVPKMSHSEKSNRRQNGQLCPMKSKMSDRTIETKRLAVSDNF